MKRRPGLPMVVAVLMPISMQPVADLQPCFPGLSRTRHPYQDGLRNPPAPVRPVRRAAKPVAWQQLAARQRSWVRSFAERLPSTFEANPFTRRIGAVRT